MNKKIECEIVKDLASAYNQKIISEKSKKIVEDHIQECDECKKYYNQINE